MEIGIIIFLVFVILISLSTALYINRHKIMKKYNIEPITASITGFALLGPIYLLIQCIKSGSIVNLISSDSEMIGATIGITFWFIVALIFFFMGNMKKGIKFLLCKLFFTLGFCFSFGFLVIFKVFGLFSSKPKYTSRYSGSTSTYNGQNDAYSSSNNNSYFVDALGYPRKIGDDYYDGSETLRRYGEDFVDGSNTLRNFSHK